MSPFGGAAVGHLNGHHIRVENVETLHPSSHVLQHYLVGKECVVFESTQAIKHIEPVVDLLCLCVFPMLGNPKSQLDKAVNGLLNNFLFSGVIDDAEVEVAAEDLVDMLGPDGMLVVVVDEVEVVVVGHQQLVDSLV